MPEIPDQLPLPHADDPALAAAIGAVGDITKDHVDMVTAYENRDMEALRLIIVEHNDHAKATMRAGIEKVGSKS